ncbi:IPT/TIG domain-containing protein [Baekduia sp.]|uniref:IPT/TIG domain-containing protein n=1 Tax=Baekduia sp. TaxID=2600305 RepID=UPI002D794B63|nr:IPT/TIG domain-containing protein [Baekduia sp.]
MVVYPTVSNIKPRKITIGQQLTVKGAHFRAGKGKSSVVFYRKGQPVVFVKADKATATSLVVTIPSKVAELLVKRDDNLVATQLRLRIVGSRMGKAWTKNSRSPIVSPIKKAVVSKPTSDGTSTSTSTPAPAAAAPPALTCQQQAALTPDADTDGDGLTNGLELRYQLDPCLADTDGDGMDDGWEYWSAQQLNGASVPYPGTKPWPNPLDPSDPNDDFDGDGLTAIQEFTLWKASKTGFPLVAYSDGTQNSGGKQPVLPGNPLDLDHDGNLTDDERDEDGDGLSNMVELNFRGEQEWWKTVDQYKDEKPYAIRQFSDLDPTNPDSDGDGILDGADDQDNDGWSNFVEAQLSRLQVGYRVQPFNPCLPDPHAATCGRWTRIGTDAWPPFDGSQQVGDAIPFAAYDADPGPGVTEAYDVTFAAWDTAGRPDRATGLLFGPWDPSPWFADAGWDGKGGPQG